MIVKDYLIRGAKIAYRFFSKKKFLNPECDIDRQSANDKIYDLLIKDKPCMISRFGTTEIIAINNYLCISSPESFFKKILNYITDNTHTPWWFEDHFHYMSVYSGIFPPNKNTAKRFAQINLEDIPLIDLLGSFQYYEKFMPLREDVQFVHLETLYPFFVERPWTRALKGKKVLVIHPFEMTINLQYQQRELLFSNTDILPEFELITLRAIQSAGDIKVPFSDWFEALEYMEKQIEKIDFDICLLGCGAYGLPLAAYIKRIGRQAVHLGGGLQLLFGIKGKRWDCSSNYGSWYKIQNLFNKNYCDLYNESWCKPLHEDTPENANKLDNGTYW
jgi:hypothetical protein